MFVGFINPVSTETPQERYQLVGDELSPIEILSIQPQVISLQPYPTP